jgi:hypothetical protein
MLWISVVLAVGGLFGGLYIGWKLAEQNWEKAGTPAKLAAALLLGLSGAVAGFSAALHLLP